MQDNIVLTILNEAKKKGKKLLFLLIDPDDFDEKRFDFSLLEQIDALLVGGSLISNGNLNSCIKFFKSNLAIPVVIFPGAPSHVSENADAILLLSLISGRNADLLIGNHVSAAFALKISPFPIVSIFIFSAYKLLSPELTFFWKFVSGGSIFLIGCIGSKGILLLVIVFIL